MKFIQKYPDMIPVYDERHGIIRGTSSKPCHYCKEHTEYVEINYEAPFCSEECLSDFERKIGV